MGIIYGLTDQGLVTKSLPVIRSDLNTAVQNAFGASFNVTDRSIAGQLLGILAERFSELWQLIEVIAGSMDPDKAAKTLLDALCLITGTKRPLARPSTTVLTLTGIDSTVVAAGSLFATLSTNQDFTTIDDATLVTVTGWVAATTYAIGARVSNNGNVYQCIQAGTSAGSVGPTGTDNTVDTTPDGGVLWTFVGFGIAAADVNAQSVANGPIVASRKDITSFVTTIGGLQTVTNLADAVLGRLVAQDLELRRLREAELATAGSTPFDALLADLTEISGVNSVTLFVNNTDTTDVDGVPPHAIEALVQGGVDQDIFNALLASVAAGIATHGNTSGTAFDSVGVAHAESFSRAEPVTLFFRLSVIVDDTIYPTDGNAEVAEAIVTHGAALPTGRDAVRSALSAQAFTVPGVLDVTQFLLYTDAIGVPVAWVTGTGYVATPGARSVVTNDGGRAYICITSGTSGGTGPSGTGVDITDGGAHWYFLGNTIAISTRQGGDYSVSNITVTSTAGTP